MLSWGLSCRRVQLASRNSSGRPLVSLPLPTLLPVKCNRQSHLRLYATRPKSKGTKSSDENPFLWIKEKWTKVQEDPKLRNRAAAGMIFFYIVVGYFGVRYLYDTKYKALGAPNPYKPAPGTMPSDSNDKIVPANDSVGGIVSSHDTTPVYDDIAAGYDSKISLEERATFIWWRRRQLMKYVKGDVLEVSCGTGRNLPYMDIDNIHSATFLDSSLQMLKIARDKFAAKFPDYENVQFVQARVEDLPAVAAGRKFDTIYETFGLCSHEDPELALRNFRQVLKPGGKIVLLEHGRSTYESLNKNLDKRADERAKEWGCRWNLDIAKIVEKSGLEIEYEKRIHFGTTYFYVLKDRGVAEHQTSQN